jgi:hypothetical protein
MPGIRTFRRVIVAAASAAAVLAFALPADAATDPGNGGRDHSPDTTTVTATCGNGLLVLGPIVVPVAPHTTTVIQCESPAPHQGVLN